MSGPEAAWPAASLEVERLRADLEATRQERDRLEAQLQRARELETVGRLATGLAHDLSNVVTVIAGHGEVLLRRLDAGVGGLRGSAEGVRQAAEWGAILVRQLLVASRHAGGEPTVVNPNDVVTGVEAVLRRLAGEDRLLIHLDPAAGAVRVELGELEQALCMLTATVSRGVDEDGRVTIATLDVTLAEPEARTLSLQPGRYVIFGIVAAGGRLAVAAVPPGLATIERIATRYGGVLRLANAPEAASTAFEIYLPVLDPAAQTNGTPDTDSLAARETILVAEDEEPVRELIRDILRLHGYAVLEARDGDEAVALAERHPGMIHLLIADMVMPGAPVSTVVQRVAAAHPELKVLYVSGYTDELIRQHGLLRLGPDFLQKPFTVEGLARKVRERLDAS